MLKQGPKTGYVIWDNKLIEKFKAAQKLKALGLPLQEMAVENFGSAVFGNAILFGAFTKIAGIFSVEAGKNTLENFVPKGALAKNQEAFDLGVAQGEEFLNNFVEESA
jgi:Pyruvate/2-oxoacid:ferredoxin oxidoreductase gamma subunit